MSLTLSYPYRPGFQVEPTAVELLCFPAPEFSEF